MVTILSWLVIALSVATFGMYYNTVVLNSTDLGDNFYEACDYYYSFNDRYGIKDPPAWLQEKRFDMERARKMSTVLAKEPEGLDQYVTLPAESTVLHAEWNRDNVALGNMCNWLTKCAQHYMHRNSTARRSRILEVMSDFVHRYAVAMTDKFDQVFPWGSNWYEFSITSTVMMFYYILVTDNSKERDFAADLILRIIVNPRLSLGRERNQANTVYMALPWIAAHYVKGDVYEAACHPAYEYAKSYIKFQTVEKRKDEGLYSDCTYITHTNVLAYGYLSEMTRMSLPLVGLDNQMRNFLLDWRRCQRVLCHREIAYGAIGFHSRDDRLTQTTVADSAYGIECIPTCLFLRMYGEDYAFSMRGQVPWIAYYESDKTNDQMAQYWVQCRRVFFRGETYEAKFPDVGFIHQTYVDESKKEMVSARCRVPTRTTTTTSFVNGPLRESANLRSGFVFAYRSVGILRHFYNCTEMIYGDESTQFRPPTEKAYGRFWADEFVLCDYEKHTVDCWVKIVKAKRCDFTLHGSESMNMNEHNSSGVFHLHWDCKTRSLTQDYKDVIATTDVIELKYPRGITVVNTDSTVMLMENGIPKMAMYPDDWLDLKSSFVTRYDDKEYEFTFDALTNQYWLAGQCVEKM